MRQQLRTLVIDRTKWGRDNNKGERTGQSLRLTARFTDNPAGADKMCCLGFACSKLGVSNRQLSAVKDGCLLAMPYDLPEKVQKTLPEWLIGGVDDHNAIADVSKLAKINDDTRLSDAQKEEQIIAIFAKHNVKVKFIN